MQKFSIPKLLKMTKIGVKIANLFMLIKPRINFNLLFNFIIKQEYHPIISIFKIKKIKKKFFISKTYCIQKIVKIFF